MLQEWLRKRADELAPDDAAKVESHPLRVLDSKRPETRAVLADAPRMVDHLDAASVAHGERVQAGLELLGIPFEVDETLVRGLDYYTHTLFEFQSSALENAQATLLGGGRYDGLIEQLGGPPTPGMGFGCGIERVLLSCDAEGVFDARRRRRSTASSSTPPAARSPRRCACVLREAGVATDRAFDDRSMKSQMKAAGKSGARVAVIVGEDEKAAGTATIRDLHGGRADDRRPRDRGRPHQEGAGHVTEPMRTHMCGELRAEHEGQAVALCGWVGRRREHGEHLAFIDLRDHTGVVQCVVDGAHDLRSEFVVRITGTVRARPEGTTNDALATGAGRGRRLHGRGAVGRRCRRRSRSTSAPTPSTR